MNKIISYICMILSELWEIFDYFLQLLPSRLGAFLRRIYFAIFLKVGKSFNVQTGVVIRGVPNITIGNFCSIMRNSSIYARDAVLMIGDNFACNENVMLGADGGKLVIGHNVLIGPNTVIRVADHKFDNIEKNINLQGHNVGSIIIEDNVWICSNVVITRGVKIGRGSVIGAGTVVTKDIPSNSVVVGSKAQIIKTRG